MEDKNTGVRSQKSADDRPTALTANAKQVARMLGVSVRQVWRLHTTGRLPRNIRLGNCVRWRVAEIAAFVEAGCPTREVWEGLRDPAYNSGKSVSLSPEKKNINHTEGSSHAG